MGLNRMPTNMIIDQATGKKLNEKLNDVDTLLAERPTKTEARLKSVFIEDADISQDLRNKMTGTTPVNNTIPANDSILPVMFKTATFTEINRRFDAYKVLEQKHGQLINKYTGIKDGTYNSTGDRKERFTLSFIDSDGTIPYPKEKVSKIMRLAYNNSTASINSANWGRKVTVNDISKPLTNGYWVKKSQLAAFASKALSPLIWFYNSSNAVVDYLTMNIYSVPTNIVVGYKNSTTKNGVTLSIEAKEENTDWIYLVISVTSSFAGTTTVEFSLTINNIPVSETGNFDIVGWTVIEGDSVSIPYWIYAENVNETSKTDAEVSSNLKTLNDTVATLNPSLKTYNTVNFGYNLEKTLLKYRSVLSKRTLQQVKIACIGDSITDGFWSGLNYERAYPVRLRKLMQAKYGGQDEGLITIDVDDQRWTQSGTGWSKDGYGIAARRRKSAVSGDYLTFTFTGVAVDIFYSKNTDGGSCAIYVDDVVQTPLNCYGATEILAQKQSYSGFASGNHTLKIYAPTDGKKAYIEGAYVKTVGDTSGIRVDRRARAGSYTGDWNTTIMLDTFTTQPADLFILALGVNDCGGNKTPEQMKTGLQTIITKLKSIGDVILIPMMQADSVADTRFVNWKDYVTKYYELADENNIGLIDVYKLYGSAYQPAQQYGLFGINNGDGEGNDTIHPSARGQQMIADAIFKLIG